MDYGGLEARKTPLSQGFECFQSRPWFTCPQSDTFALNGGLEAHHILGNL